MPLTARRYNSAQCARPRARGSTAKLFADLSVSGSFSREQLASEERLGLVEQALPAEQHGELAPPISSSLARLRAFTAAQPH